MPAPAAAADACPTPAAAASAATTAVADREPQHEDQDSWSLPQGGLEIGPEGELASPQSPGAQADEDASPRSVLQVQEAWVSCCQHLQTHTPV